MIKGRKLYYVKPHMRHETHIEEDPETKEKKVVVSPRESLHYWGMNQETKKWQVIPTYGGKLVENIVQAIARDCLAVAMQRLAAAGYQTVFHVHDEGIQDVPKVAADVNRICEIMGQPISWAPGLLLKAAGFETSYYRKDD
jgi:DNA polymerase